MTRSGSTGTSVGDGAIEPLLEEVHAAEAAWRDGELPRLSPADRLAVGVARALLSSSRHRRERAAGAQAVDHTFEHRVEAGMPR
jgi:hypothetical protein